MKRLFLIVLVLGFSLAFNKLVFAGDVEVKLNSNDGTTDFEVQDSDGAVVTMIDSDGNVGIGTTAPGAAKLHVKKTTNSGSFEIAGSFSNSAAVTTGSYPVIIGVEGYASAASSAVEPWLIAGGSFSAANYGSSDVGNSMKAISLNADNRGTGAVGALGGITMQISNGASGLVAGTVTNAYGLWMNNYARYNATISNLHGVYIDNPWTSDGGVITNNYGIYIKNQTGGSNSNYAIYSAGGTNYFGGSVGIGTTAPAMALDVKDDIANNYAMRIFNDGNSTNRYGLKIQCGRDDETGINYPLWFYDGDGTGSQGGISFTSGTVTYGAFTANHDVSVPEEYNENGYPYGTLICIKSTSGNEDQLRKVLYDVSACNESYSKKVLGAYAGKYDHKDNLHQVYVLGDGHILVNNQGGNIEIGDPITTSSSEGIGMKANDTGMIVGFAQEDYIFTGQDDTKLLAVQYGLSSYSGEGFAVSEGERDLSATVSAQNEVIKSLIKRIETLEETIAGL